jgi:tRNA dimethylallyltransferase
MSAEPPIKPLFIVGATCSGKSSLALAMAESLDGEIVNADAFQLYKGLDICTAKPSLEDMARVRHHLYGALSIDDLSDAKFYSELANPVIKDIANRGRLPIVVGGSGLYVKALTHGLGPLPPGDEGLREKLASMTPGERVTWLLLRDPAARTTINLKNDRYVTRALEICILTGKPQSALRQAWEQNTPSFTGICLSWERAELYSRINERVIAMFKAGLINEIGRLGETKGTAMKAIGVAEVQTYLRDECSLPEAMEVMQQNTRNYAKRQATWFKREHGFKTLTMAAGEMTDSLLRRALELHPQLRSRLLKMQGS